MSHDKLNRLRRDLDSARRRLDEDEPFVESILCDIIEVLHEILDEEDDRGLVGGATYQG